jgi:dihydrofolate reductase
MRIGYWLVGISHSLADAREAYCVYMPDHASVPRPTRVRVYVACSLDGFIAGSGDDLSWLPGADPHAVETVDAGAPAQDAGALSYDEFMVDIGALLLGRRTFDVFMSFGVPWPYEERPVFVATRRPLKAPNANVQAIAGDLPTMVDIARQAAGGKDVYVDGGDLIRQALDAGLIDELIVTMVPIVLGEGYSLFAGVTRRHRFDIVGHYRYVNGMVQFHARPKQRPAT